MIGFPTFEESYMASFHVYMDESGQSNNSTCVAMCGYVSGAQEWEAFSHKWDAFRLANDLPPIHTSDMMNFARKWKRKQREWGKDAEPRRDDILNRAALMVQSFELVALGAAVDATYFGHMQQCEFKRRAEDPHFLAFQRAILTALKITENQRHNAISIVMDDSDRFSVKCYRLLNKIKLKYPEMAKRLAGICFVKDDFCPPVQAADMLAYFTRREVQNLPQSKLELIKANPLYLCLTRGGAHQPLLMNGNNLEEMRKHVESGRDKTL